VNIQVMTKAGGPKSKKARGFDAPAEDDILGRRPLARTIAEVVRNTPPDYGVRIGIFGEWGSGKSSVLEFVEQILDASEHVVVRFSPWGITDRGDLWRSLGVALSESLQAIGDGKRGTLAMRLKFKYDKKALRVLEAGRSLVRLIPHAGSVADAVAAPALEAVRYLLRATEEQLTSFAKPGDRIVVMIDDLDRTDPMLVPPILFALRELFDIKRFSWILAMDPVVVRAALEHYHPGFARGRDFLEKIVDFPFNLRAPDRSHRVALLRRDLRENGIKLDDVKLTEVGGLLPENPRELRAIVRHLRTIAGTLARLRPDEVDRRLLLTLVIIHAAAPNLLENLLSSRKALKRITSLKLFKKDSDRRSKEILQEAKERAARLLKRSEVRKQDRPRMRKLLRRIGDGGYWAPETVIAAGRLLYAPPIVTGRETDEAVAAAHDSTALRKWLAGFARRQDHSVAEVHAALFGRLLAAHDREMNNAIGAFGDEEMKRAIAAVIQIVKVLEMLLFDLAAVSKFKPAKLERMRRAFSQWAHFIRPEDYEPARKAERDLLLRWAKATELDPLEALARVAVHHRDLVQDEGDQARRQLNVDLFSALEDRAALKFAELLDTENLVSVFRSRRRSGRYLLRGDGLIWTMKFRGQLRGALEGERSVARADNAMDLLRAITGLPESAQRTLLLDTDLVGLLWQAATSVAPAMRRFDSIERLRGEVEKVSGPQQTPPWWEPKREQYLVAVRRRQAAEQEPVPTAEQPPAPGAEPSAQEPPVASNDGPPAK
jgi:hypothetical protein